MTLMVADRQVVAGKAGGTGNIELDEFGSQISTAVGGIKCHFMDFIIGGDLHFHVAGADGGGPHNGQNDQK